MGPGDGARHDAAPDSRRREPLDGGPAQWLAESADYPVLFTDQGRDPATARPGREADLAMLERWTGDLFAHTPAQRVQATTDVGNTAEQKALSRAGFVREGVLRSYQFRLGAWHDLATFARVRGD